MVFHGEIFLSFHYGSVSWPWKVWFWIILDYTESIDFQIVCLCLYVSVDFPTEFLAELTNSQLN